MEEFQKILWGLVRKTAGDTPFQAQRADFRRNGEPAHGVQMHHDVAHHLWVPREGRLIGLDGNRQFFYVWELRNGALEVHEDFLASNFYKLDAMRLAAATLETNLARDIAGELLLQLCQYRLHLVLGKFECIIGSEGLVQECGFRNGGLATGDLALLDGGREHGGDRTTGLCPGIAPKLKNKKDLV